MNSLSKLVFGLVAAASVSQAWAQVNSYSDGSDGAFNPSATTTTVDLGLAPTATWTAPGTGNGVYDGTKWAVVFKYSSVNIAAGKTVNFTNHPKNAPVVWLVQGNVTISGVLSLDAMQAGRGTGLLSVPGPGGFAGGSHGPQGSTWSAGFGPGGSSSVNGYTTGEGGSFGTQPLGGAQAGMGPIYGNAQILPLIGGSGSKTRAFNSAAGGGAGGAILIVATGTITINGTIRANGSSDDGGFSGSGGAIRMIADRFSGSGSIEARPNNDYGGMGRVRLERLYEPGSFAGSVIPGASGAVLAGPEPMIWPPSTHPKLVVTSVDGVPVPADPVASFASSDVQIGPAAQSVFRMEAANIPTDGTWRVQVRIVPRTGTDLFVNATLVSGNQVASIWEASAAVPIGASSVIARAYKL